MKVKSYWKTLSQHNFQLEASKEILQLYTLEYWLNDTYQTGKNLNPHRISFILS